MDLNITELKSYLDVIQCLIDNTIREAKMNNTENLHSNQRLQKFNKYRNMIINEIEEKLDETFNKKH